MAPYPRKSKEYVCNECGAPAEEDPSPFLTQDGTQYVWAPQRCSDRKCVNRHRLYFEKDWYSPVATG